jgi:hypothetical protein
MLNYQRVDCGHSFIPQPAAPKKPSGSPPAGQARVDRLQVDPVGLSSEMAKPSECGKTMCEWDMLYML